MGCAWARVKCWKGGRAAKTGWRGSEEEDSKERQGGQDEQGQKGAAINKAVITIIIEFLLHNAKFRSFQLSLSRLN